MSTAIATASLAAPRFHKVSETGHILPKKAKDWAIVFDSLTDLMWPRYALPCGQVAFARAQSEPRKLRLAGFKDWRSATRLEWANVMDDSLYAPVIDTNFFTLADPYEAVWTSTKCAPASYAFVVYLHGGLVDRLHHVYPFSVRAVRAGQPLGYLAAA